MGLGERLGRLDDRLLPRRLNQHWDAEAPRWSRLLAGAGLALVGASAIFVGVAGLGRGSPPLLGFNCVAASHATVESVLGTKVDTSEGVGGVRSQQATGAWLSAGDPVIHVTCTAVADIERRAITPDTDGYQAGDPPIAVTHTDADDGFQTLVRFVHESAIVEMRTSETIDAHDARTLVESWKGMVAMFGSR